MPHDMMGGLGSIWFAQDVVIAKIALTIATTGVPVTLAQFWCLPTAVLARVAAASGISVIKSVGNLAGFVSTTPLSGSSMPLIRPAWASTRSPAAC